ncbi:fatty acid hydroxylase domain-containing protein 2 [Heptranchias perlo]|uniref:fatty acid hydroxylase domain-containing protein 2 n=1 Tax=Heptranchias perlo TaxID=212740 RepID=UPI0035596A56
MRGWEEQPDSAGTQGQERHVWDSVKKAAFILGSGVFVFAAFSNTVTWHLQQFWGASGNFWQAQWGKAHSSFEEKEWVPFFLGAMVIPTIVFWLFNGLLLIVDATGKPQVIARYRIQMGRNDPVEPARLQQAIRTVAFNQVFLSFPMVLLLYPIMKWRGNPCSLELPAFHWVLLQLCFLGLLEEILFYYSHRLFHHPTLYKHIHKKHHEWTAPIGIIALYAHPIEHVFSNMVPTMLGPILLGTHVTTMMLWFSLALLTSTVSHCGYHLPFLPSPEFHDFHHLRFNQCYGVFGILDRLHQTDTIFRESKAYERHTLLLGLTPLSETIPDSLKTK